jgi:saccharopine dehydrogenase-like NADP-dependent oxidoreductase
MRDVGLSLVGKTCAGVWVKGKKDGMTREVYIYQVADNQECIERLNCPAVTAQTACCPVIVTGLIAEGKIEGPYGARVSEEYSPEPVLSRLADYGFPAGILEMESEYREHLEEQALLGYFK